MKIRYIAFIIFAGCFGQLALATENELTAETALSQLQECQNSFTPIKYFSTKTKKNANKIQETINSCKNFASILPPWANNLLSLQNPFKEFNPDTTRKTICNCQQKYKKYAKQIKETIKNLSPNLPDTITKKIKKLREDEEDPKNLINFGYEIVSLYIEEFNVIIANLEHTNKKKEAAGVIEIRNNLEKVKSKNETFDTLKFDEIKKSFEKSKNQIFQEATTRYKKIPLTLLDAPIEQLSQNNIYQTHIKLREKIANLLTKLNTLKYSNEYRLENCQKAAKTYSKLLNLPPRVFFNNKETVELKIANDAYPEKKIDDLISDIRIHLRDNTGKQELNEINHQIDTDPAKNAIYTYLANQTKTILTADPNLEKVPSIEKLLTILHKYKTLKNCTDITRFKKNRTNKEKVKRLIIATTLAQQLQTDYQDNKTTTMLQKSCLNILSNYISHAKDKEEIALEKNSEFDNEFITVTNNCRLVLDLTDQTLKEPTKEQILALLQLYTNDNFEGLQEIYHYNPYMKTVHTEQIKWAKDKYNVDPTNSEIITILREVLFLHRFLAKNQTHIAGYLLLKYYDQTKQQNDSATQLLAEKVITKTLCSCADIFPEGNKFISHFNSLSTKSQETILTLLSRPFNQEQKDGIEIFLKTLKNPTSKRERKEKYLLLFDDKQNLVALENKPLDNPKENVHEENEETNTWMSGIKNQTGKIVNTIKEKVLPEQIQTVVNNISLGYNYYINNKNTWENNQLIKNRTWIADKTVNTVLPWTRSIVLYLSSQDETKVPEDKTFITDLNSFIHENPALFPVDEETGKPKPLELTITPMLTTTLIMLGIKKNHFNTTKTILNTFNDILDEDEDEYSNLLTFCSWADAVEEIHNLPLKPEKNEPEKTKKEILNIFKKITTYIDDNQYTKDETIKTQLELLEIQNNTFIDNDQTYEKLLNQMKLFGAIVTIQLTWDHNKKATGFGIYQALIKWLERQKTTIQQEGLQNTTVQETLTIISKKAKQDDIQVFCNTAKNLNLKQLKTINETILAPSIEETDKKTWNSWAEQIGNEKYINRATQKEQSSPANLKRNIIITGSAVTFAGTIAYLTYKTMRKKSSSINLPKTSTTRFNTPTTKMSSPRLYA